MNRFIRDNEMRMKRLEMIMYNLNSKILDRTHNVYYIKEFEPIREMCRVWLSQRDEDRYRVTNQELLERYMDTLWVPIGGYSNRFSCKFVIRYDFGDHNDKAKCWIECMKNYLNNSVKIYSRNLILEKV